MENEETAQEVKAKLAAGKDLAELSKQYSIDESTKEQGRDLGYFARGEMVNQKAQTDYSVRLQERYGEYKIENYVSNALS